MKFRTSPGQFHHEPPLSSGGFPWTTAPLTIWIRSTILELDHCLMHCCFTDCKAFTYVIARSVYPSWRIITIWARYASERDCFLPWGKNIMTKNEKQPHCWMVDCLWLETVSCVTLSLTIKDDAITNDFWCNTAEQVALHTKINFGLKLLATAVK